MGLSTAAASIKSRGTKVTGANRTIAQVIKAGAVKSSGATSTIEQTIAAKLPEIKAQAVEIKETTEARKLKAAAQAQYSGQTRAGEYAARIRASAAVPIAIGSTGFKALAERRAQEAEGVAPTAEKYTSHFYQVKGKEGAVGFSYDIGKPPKQNKSEQLASIFVVGQEKFGEAKSWLETQYNKADAFLKPYSQKIIPEAFPSAIFNMSQSIKPNITQANKWNIFTWKDYATGKALEFEAGYLTGLREKPAQVATSTAAFFLLPKGLKLIGKGVTLLPYGQKALSIAAPVIEYGLLGYYSYDVGKRTLSSKYPAMELGNIAATEFTPMIVGGATGSKFWQMQEGYFATLGRKKIATENLVPAEVISGAKNFPEANPKTHLKQFLYSKYKLPTAEKPMMYHAAPQPLGNLKVAEGSSELAGLYGSSAVSAYFLKVGTGESRLYGGGLFEPYSSPRVAAITPQSFRVNKAIRTQEGWKLSKETITGVADIPQMKTEIEAVLPVGTTLEPAGKQYYFKWKGVRTPIDEFNVIGGEVKPLRTVKASELSSSYRLPYTSVITAPSLAASSIISKAFSYSYKSSKVSSISSVSSSLSSTTSSTSSLVSNPSSLISSLTSSSTSRTSSRVSSRISSRASSSVFSSNIISSSTTTPTTRKIKFNGNVFIPNNKKDRLVKFKPKYFASVEASAFNIKGKPSKWATITGLGIRPIRR